MASDFSGTWQLESVDNQEAYMAMMKDMFGSCAPKADFKPSVSIKQAADTFSVTSTMGKSAAQTFSHTFTIGEDFEHQIGAKTVTGRASWKDNKLVVTTDCGAKRATKTKEIAPNGQMMETIISDGCPTINLVYNKI